ncbi:hypothetical protein FRB94_012879 [Tulasnella sp. JGI-2019a]|nr:hypothetical protein FRB94_012879 [Tulasnella sp. JGI-2019a]
MNRPSDEAIDQALSILALSLNDKDKPDYNVFAPDIHGSTEEVDRDIQLMKGVQSSLNDRISGIITQRPTYRNTIMSKIYMIPSEIFTRILSESIDIKNWNTQHLHTLARVSKYWATTVLSTPELWPIIKYNTGRSAQRHLWYRALKISKQLLISCQIHSGDRPLRKKETIALRRISEESHRWKSMNFKGPMGPEIIRLLESPCPKVERLALKQVLEDFDDPGDPIHLDIPFGDRVREVRLEYVNLRWDKCVLSDLRTLCLRMLSWEVSGGPSWKQILAILSHSPRLEVLDLSEVQIPRGHDADPPEAVKQIANAERICLPFLQTLKISMILPEIPATIFTSVDAPCINHFHWRRRVESFTTEWLSLHCAQPSRNIVGCLLASVTSGEITVQLRGATENLYLFNIDVRGGGNSRVVRSAAGGDVEGGVRRFKTYIHADLENTFDMFGFGSVVATLSLSINSSVTSDHFPPSLLDTLPAIRRLDLFRVPNTVEILSHLSRRSGLTGRWPCPMMTHLTVTTMEDLEEGAVISFQRARYPKEMDADVGEMELPVPLVSLVVSVLT